MHFENDYYGLTKQLSELYDKTCEIKHIQAISLFLGYIIKEYFILLMPYLDVW